MPIHKRWEANRSRLQVLKQDKNIQLVAFFEDFVHAGCINFALKSTDVFESFNKSAKFYIRIVDAKFALPKDGEGAKRKFVCLDMPEYPGEHDDITIAFDTEAGALKTSPVKLELPRLTLIRRTGQVLGSSPIGSGESVEDGIIAEMKQSNLHLTGLGDGFSIINLLTITVGGCIAQLDL